jgi:hypothetical protein
MNRSEEIDVTSVEECGIFGILYSAVLFSKFSFSNE